MIPRPIHLSLLLIISLLFIDYSFAQNKQNSGRQFSNREELEKLLQSNVAFGKDTTALKNSLNKIFSKAKGLSKNELEWAHHLLLADGFSIAFDNVNYRSDYYFNKAYSFISEEEDKELWMVTNIRRGYYYYTYREIKDAFPYFLHANDAFETADVKEVPLVANHYSYIANFFNMIGDPKKAIQYLNKAIAFSDPVSRKRIDMLNSIAVFHRKDNNKIEAHNYSLYALDVAKEAKDSVWIGIISGNLSDDEWEKGNKEKAISLVKQNIVLSTKYNELLDAMRANLNLSKMYVDQKQWDLALKALDESFQLMEDKPYFLRYRTEATKVLADIAANTGNKEVELSTLKQFIVLNDSLDKQMDQDLLQKMNWQWEAERYQNAANSAEAKRRQTKLTYQYLGVLLIFGFIIGILLIHRSRNKILIRSTLLEKEQLSLSFEKKLVDQELILIKDSLQEFTDTIKHNDATIQQLQKELRSINSDNPDQEGKILNNLNTMLESHLMTDDRWLKFKNVFDKVYPNYLQNEKDNHPKLSENDLRLLALIKLELSNRSMSDLLGVSIEGIKKAKQRLKKKMEELVG